MSALDAKEPAATFRYDLPTELIETLTAKLIGSKRSEADRRFVCYRVSGNSEFSDIGRHLERQVFEETFPGNDAAFMACEYGPYECASIFFLSVDRANERAIGVLRVIRNSPAGLKTVNDLAQPESPVHLTFEQVVAYHNIKELGGAWDVGTVAIPKRYRRSGVSASLQLYRGMYVTALEQNIEHLVAVIDKAPLLALTDYLGIPFVPLCGSDYFSYLESAESRAVYGYVPSFYDAVDKRLQEMSGDPVAVRALRKLGKGSEDHALLFDSGYKR